MQKTAGGRDKRKRKSTEETTEKGARASFPSGAADVDSFLFQFSPSITHTIFSLQLNLSFTFWPGRTGSKIDQVCLKWCHDCTAVDSHSCSCFSSHSPTGALGIVGHTRWVPVLIHMQFIYWSWVQDGNYCLLQALGQSFFVKCPR